jgi:mono/diheme cytochrome c family protein
LRNTVVITLLALVIGMLINYGATRPVATAAAPPPAAQATPLVADGATLPAGPQLAALQASCQICHSFGLVTQQRLSAATWKAEIVKMRGFGSPLPAADEAPVVAYLAAHLGPSVPAPPPHTVVTAPPVTYTNAETAASASTANAPSKGTGGSPAGAQLYAQNCAACHGAAGAGVPGAFPPLAHDPVVTAANPAGHITVVLKGMHGKAIGGKSYSSQMPSFTQLSDNDIAAIIDHERTSWGNHAPIVTPDQVKRAR